MDKSDQESLKQFNGLMKEIKRLEELNSKINSQKRYYQTLFNCILDEINENQMRASVMNNSDLDLATTRFYEGQIVVLDRILKSIDYECKNVT